MNIVKATKRFEDWLRLHIPIVGPDLRFKHEQMAAALFPFFRATFYRWLQQWPEVCPELERVPHILSVGDLHVENFGTWRDTDGRLVWGVNDFDEACLFPYTMDLVRLATSALLATREDRMAMKPKGSAAAILAGYERGMEEGGRPFVLEESHEWLRAIAESKLRDPVPAGAAGGGARKSGADPAGGDRGVEGRAGGARSEGAGAIGVALAECEANAGGYFVRGDPQAGGAVSGSLCADAVALDRAPAVAALFARRTGGAWNQPRGAAVAGGDGERDGEYSRRNGGKAQGDPEGLARAKRELAGGSGGGDGRRDGERLASMEGALAELDSASA